MLQAEQITTMFSSPIVQSLTARLGAMPLQDYQRNRQARFTLEEHVAAVVYWLYKHGRNAIRRPSKQLLRIAVLVQDHQDVSLCSLQDQCVGAPACTGMRCLSAMVPQKVPVRYVHSIKSFHIIVIYSSRSFNV